jgi:hypothetical protein
MTVAGSAAELDEDPSRLSPVNEYSCTIYAVSGRTRSLRWGGTRGSAHA